MHATKDALLQAGLEMLLEQGYASLGIRAILARTGIPKGSFYHHFATKEEFAMSVIDRYMEDVHQGLATHLSDTTRTPLERVRGFFEATEEKYQSEGYLGCLLGGLGQELCGVSSVFQEKIEGCLTHIASAVATTLQEGIDSGLLRADCDSEAMANLLVDCWEGAALRSRLWRDPAPLQNVLDFYFRSLETS